jgi:hypothetical protein
MGRTVNGLSAIAIGSEYTDDELELIRAMQGYMRENNIRFPKFTDVLKVAKALGYRKVGALQVAPQTTTPTFKESVNAASKRKQPRKHTNTGA